MRSTFLAWFVSLLLLTGCASFDASKPQSHVADANALQAEHALQGGGSAPWPQLDWWKSLGDPQLAQLVDEALVRSPSLSLAQARVRKAQALARMAGAALAPQVNGNASLNYQRFSENFIFPPPFGGGWYWQDSATLDFSYEFDFWGKNHAAVRAALGEQRAAEADVFAARLVLSVAITQAYLELERDYAQLDVAHATLEQREKLQQLTAQRFGAGLDSRVELKQAETAVPETRERIAQLEESLALTRNRIAALAGAGPDRGLSITRPKTNVTAVGLPSTLPAELIGRRPDVIANRLRVEAASAQIDEARAAFYPNVSLTAFAGLQSLGLAEFLRAGSLVAGAGPAISLPIFNGGRLRANLSGKHADYDAAVEEYNASLVEALHQVADQLASMRSLEVQRTEQQRALAAAQEAYDLSIVRYREGLGNYLQVLAAETAVLAQKSLAADLDARGRVLSVNLIRALGGGYEGAKS